MLNRERALNPAVIQECCYDIGTPSPAFLFEILPKLYFEEIKNLLTSFSEVVEANTETDKVIKFLNSFVHLLQIFTTCYSLQEDQACYLKILDVFYQNNCHLLKDLSVLTSYNKAMLIRLAEKYWNNSFEMIAIASALRNYQISQDKTAIIEPWHNLFLDKITGYLKIVSNNQRNSLMMLLKSESDVSTVATVLKQHLPTILFWDKDSILDVVQNTPWRYWHHIPKLIFDSISLLKEKLNHHSSDYVEMTLILNSLSEMVSIINGKDRTECLYRLFDNIDEEIRELTQRDNKWVDNLLKALGSSLESQKDCNEICQAITRIQQSNLDKIENNNLSPELKSQEFMLDSLFDAVIERKEALSIKTCEDITTSFLVGGVSKLSIKLEKNWSQVDYLPQCYLTKWLALFIPDLKAVEQIILYLCMLRLIKEDRINLWRVFADLKWHQKAHYTLLNHAGYRIESYRGSSIETLSDYVRRKEGMMSPDFSRVLQVLNDTSSFYTLCEYLRCNHLLFLKEWEEPLMDHILQAPEPWIQSPETLGIALSLLGWGRLKNLYRVAPDLTKYLPFLNLREKSLLDDSVQPVQRQEQYSLVQRLHAPWLVHERQFYFDDNFEDFCQFLSQENLGLEQVFSLVKGLTRVEKDKLQPSLTAFIARVTQNEASEFFTKFFSLIDGVKIAEAQIKLLPIESQFELLEKGFSQLKSPVSLSQFHSWKDFLLNFMESFDRKSCATDKLTNIFDKFLQDNLDIVIRKKSETLDFSRQDLNNVFQLRAHLVQNHLMTSSLMTSCIRLIDMLNTRSSQLMKLPGTREIVHDIFRGATPALLDFWDLQSYRLIDTVEIFETVLLKLTPQKQQQLWGLCDPYFEFWVQDSKSLISLLRCASTEAQQREILEKLPNCYNWIKGAQDFCELLDVFINMNNASDILQKWPIYSFMYTIYDYMEILQKARYCGVGNRFLQKYRDEFYAASSNPQPLNIAQWQRLDREICNLIVITEVFSQDKIGHRLVEVLIEAENQGNDSRAERERINLRLSEVCQNIKICYGDDSLDILSDYWYEFVEFIGLIEFIKQYDAEQEALSLTSRNTLTFSTQQFSNRACENIVETSNKPQDETQIKQNKIKKIGAIYKAPK